MRAATARPMVVEPVAETSLTCGSSTSHSPCSRAPRMTSESPAGTSPNVERAFATARSKRTWQASAVSGVFSDGFHSTGLPQTHASAAFHAHTATGKLKALMTAVGPSGCQVSIMRWPGRSEAIVRP